MAKTYIGIAGCSCSGKTTFGKALAAYLHSAGKTAKYMTLDDYYAGWAKMKVAGLKKDEGTSIDWDYDHPDALELEEFSGHIQALKQGHVSDMRKGYVFEQGLPAESVEPVNPSEFEYIIVEGLYALYPDALVGCLDKKIFVNTDMELCFERRKDRFTKEYEMTMSDAEAQWHRDVAPNFTQFVEPTKSKADTVYDFKTEKALRAGLEDTIRGFGLEVNSHLVTVAIDEAFGKRGRIEGQSAPPSPADEGAPPPAQTPVRNALGKGGASAASVVRELGFEDAAPV